jgi:hypothetical protein
MIKKFLKLFSLMTIAISIFFSNTFIVTKAIDNENINGDMQEIYNEEISNSIISGTGTEDDPYILDQSKSPEFTEYLEEKGNLLCNEINSSQESNTTNSAVSLASNFDKILSGKAHSNQTTGGYWKYSSGGMSVSSNGNIRVKKIAYYPYEYVQNFISAKSNKTFWSVLKANATDIKNYGFTQAVNYLVKKKLSNKAATTFAGFLAKGTLYFDTYLLFLDVYNDFNMIPYNNANSDKKGVFTIEYQTSYNGKWYLYDVTDEWAKYKTAYEPNTTYGKGTYTSGMKYK